MRLLEISTSAMEFLSYALGQMGVGAGSSPLRDATEAVPVIRKRPLISYSSVGLTGFEPATP